MDLLFKLLQSRGMRTGKKERAENKRAGFGITQYKMFRLIGSHMHEKQSIP